MNQWKTELEIILKLIPGYNPWDQAAGCSAWLDHDAALAAINWFPDNLKHVEGSAQGTEFLLRSWQAAIVGNLFGWKRKDDAGRIVRRYRKFLFYVPRGNGKTPLAAGIALLAFYEDQEPGQQDYLAAKDRDQADFLFRNASGMIAQNDRLRDEVTVYRGDQHRSIVSNADPLSFVKVIPGDARHGGIPHIALIDELHEQPNRDLVDVFESALIKKTRSQPLLGMLTTADYERESICNEVHQHACNVRDNGGDPLKPGYDPAFLPVIYETLATDDWRSEETWRNANPNLGVSVSLEGMREACKKAEESPSYENVFRRLNLNQKTKQEMRLISTQAWDLCGRHGRPARDSDAQEVEGDGAGEGEDTGKLPVPPTVADLDGRECFGGLDLASNDDLASLSLAFPLDADWDGWLAMLSFSWCPESRVIRRARQKFPYDIWARNGYGVDGLPNFLNPTPGDWIDFDRIQADVLQLSQRYWIREIGYDRHGASQLMQNLIAEGMVVIPISQTFRDLAGPTKDLYRRVCLRRIFHFQNPVLRWAVGNAAVHFDGKLPQGGKIEDHLDKVPIMLSKRQSADKIDPIAAMVSALARLGAHPEEGAGSGKIQFI